MSRSLDPIVTSQGRACEPPRRFARLERGEQLMLWSVRAIALGHAESPALQRVLQVSLGSAAQETFAAVFVAVRTLGWCARRRLRLHLPGCDGVSEDEIWLLELFGEAQQALVWGDERAVRRRLGEVVDAPTAEGLLMTLQAATSALEVNGYPLGGPAHRPAAPPGRQWH